MSKVWILGPCSIENRDLFFECLTRINSIMCDDDDWYMKASFDKATEPPFTEVADPD
jgi:3-deoxy-D-manno-octulosonic acid (KDO) 8-phosphate synthase